MFETSVVKERVAPRRRASVFAASIAAHSVVIAGIVFISISSTSFPKDAPNEMARWMPVMPVDIPLPKGNPNAPRQPQQQPQQQKPAQQQAQTAPPQTVTPNQIPSSIPTVPAATSTATDVTPGSGTNTSERWGDPNGDPRSIDIGQSPATPATGVPDVVYHPGADVKPATVLYRAQPNYPRLAITTRMPGWVFVKCIIGKTGEVRDIEVVKSSNSMFEQAAVDALRQWKFAPGYFHGQPVDTYFELKITFEVR